VPVVIGVESLAGFSPEPPRVQIDDAARQTAVLLDAPPGIVEVVEEIL